MIQKIIEELKLKNNLSFDDVKQAMHEMLSGKTSEQENYDFLKYLTEKGETDEELRSMLEEMERFSLRVSPKNKGTIIDVCGTGGDKLQTFNISTTAAFVIAASGGIVAKHGNRSSSGVSGSADIFENFGYDLDLGPEKASDILEKFQIVFMFAQKFHPAMKNVGPARKRLGMRTAFNLLGPLTNPAGVKNQLIGVSSDEFLDRLPLILKPRGVQNIMTVRSEDGMDEFSTSSKNKICFLKNGKLLTNVIDPEIIGLHKSSLKDIQIKTKDEALKSFITVLNNTAHRSMIETTALNAAAGLIVGNVVKNFDEGIDLALSTIRNERAYKLVKNFFAENGDIGKIREVEEA